MTEQTETILLSHEQKIVDATNAIERRINIFSGDCAQREIALIVKEIPEAITHGQILRIIYDGLNRTEIGFKACARTLIYTLPKKESGVSQQEAFKRFITMRIAFNRYEEINKPKEGDGHNKKWHKETSIENSLKMRKYIARRADYVVPSL